MKKIIESKSFKLKIFLIGGTKDSINIKENCKSLYILTTTTTTDYGGKLAKKQDLMM